MRHCVVKLSTRSRYGCRAMMELAVAFVTGPMSVSDIARRQGVSAKYLEHLLAALKAADLVRAVRGAQGGYMLTRDPRKILLSDVIPVLEGDTGPVDCVTHPDVCRKSEGCGTRKVWKRLHTVTMDVLGSTSIHDLANEDEWASGILGTCPDPQPDDPESEQSTSQE